MALSALPAVWLVGSAWGATYTALHTAFVPKLTAVEAAAAALPVGLTLSAWLTLVLKTLFGSIGLSPMLIGVVCVLQGVALAAGVKMALCEATVRDKARVAKSLNQIKSPLSMLTGLVVWMAFLFYTHSLQRVGNGFNVGGTSWSDLPFHLNLIASFVDGINANASLTTGVVAPFFAGSNLVYPYIPDFHAAMLVASGCSIQVALALPGVLLVTSFLVLLFTLNLRLTSSPRAAVVAVNLVLFSGGPGALQLFTHGLSWENMIKKDHVLHTLEGSTAFWFSLPAHILLPQRTTQYAYPVVLACLLLLVKAHARPQKSKVEDRLGFDSYAPLEDFWSQLSQADHRRFYIGAGLIAGLLPLLQPHAFVAVALITSTVAALQLIPYLLPTKLGGSKSSLMQLLTLWASFATAGFTVALPQFMAYLSRVQSSSSFLRLETIWAALPGEAGFTSTWLKALGLFVPLYLVAPLAGMRRHQLRFHVGFGVVFFVANFLIFQPWAFDNTKIFYVWAFGAAGSVAFLLDKLWTLPAGVLRLAGRVAYCLAVASLVFSGLICTVRETSSSDQLYDLADVESGEWFKANTPSDATVLTMSNIKTFRPESALAGRQLLNGYEGWLVSHGVDFEQRSKDANTIGTGGPGAQQLIKELGVTHIVVDWARRQHFNINFLNEVALHIADNGRYGIFEVVDHSLIGSGGDCEAHDWRGCEALGCRWEMTPESSSCITPPASIIAPQVEDCGFEGVTAETCNDLGCSWYAGYAGPWCQKRVLPDGARKPMSSELDDTLECGWPGISEFQCLNRGCKWGPPEPTDKTDAWCRPDEAKRSTALFTHGKPQKPEADSTSPSVSGDMNIMNEDDAE